MATSKAKEEIEILSPEVEEIIDTEIETSLVKQNVTETLLSKLETEYKDLKINGQEDKEGYLMVQAARKDCKTVRVLIGKICKAGRAKANAESKKWVNKENTLTERVSKVEDRLEADETAYELERDRRKQLEAQRLAQQNIDRTQHMVAFGARIEDGNWVLGDISYESILVSQCDADIYRGIYDQCKAVFNVNEQGKREEKERQETARLELQRQQDDLKRQQQEVKDMRTQGRISFLESLGMGKSKTGGAYAYAGHTILLMDIQEQEERDWEVMIAGAREGIEKAKEEEKKRKAKILKDQEDEKRWRGRLDQLKEITWDGQGAFPKWDKYKHVFTYIELINLSDQEFSERKDAHNAKANELAEQARQKLEEKRMRDLEDARLEGIGKGRRTLLDAISTTTGMSDLELGKQKVDVWEAVLSDAKDKFEQRRRELLNEKQKYDELIAELKAIDIPEVKNGQLRAKINAIKSFIEGLK